MNNKMKTMLISLLAILLIVSCSKNSSNSTTSDNNNNGDENTTQKLIAFSIFCYKNAQDPKRPIVVGIRIFDQTSGRRLMTGSSNSNGYFCSGESFDISKPLRIEFYEYPDQECILWVKNITYKNNPGLWVDSYGEDNGADFNIGQCDNLSPINDCWEY